MEDFSQALKKTNLVTESEISQYRKEAFIVEADEETIDKWEKFMELEYKPDYSLQDRIDRVLYTLQARGSFTKEFLKNQGRLFLNGELEVEELFSQYHFIIRFTSIVGVPENLENFKDMVDLNKPAHLTYEFKFRYNTHGQLEILTHGEMEQYTHDELYQKRVFDDSQLPASLFKRSVMNIKSIAALIFPLKTDYYNVDIFNDNFRFLDEKKQNIIDNELPTTSKTIVGAIKEIFTELWKTGSTTQFGRFKVGNNLSVDANGFLNGNPSYTHPSGNGNTHLPSNGATGQFIKWLSAGVGQWATVTWGDITGKPSTFTPSSHTHSKSQITDFAHTHVKAEIADFSHTHDDRYYTEAEIEEKFKNFCPFPVNSLFLTLGTENPATLFLGTTWQKQEGRFLLGSNASYALGSTGGSSTITLTEANMPRHRHQVDSTTATIPAHTHPYKIGGGNYGGPGNSEGGLGGSKYTGNTLSAGGGSTGAIAPYTSYVGSGTAFNNMPPYLVVNIWKRLT